ncbi:hypothetical protein [Reichenbachiella agariperforans]|uniref:hypothetical protein n=1 Tax=Reichenbachiella agariperforans TaxID=156994 RepID=UPI001C092E63|nr:hypothetical protein [Reichenbachiella agariperforans]MBU2912558.1 hypothetical protein [Reichenbachiella agariperforans]
MKRSRSSETVFRYWAFSLSVCFVPSVALLYVDFVSFSQTTISGIYSLAFVKAGKR